MTVATTVVYETKRCLACGASSLMALDPAGFVQWQSGAFVQDAFPDMGAPEREQLISGTHPACWKELFADEEDEA